MPLLESAHVIHVGTIRYIGVHTSCNHQPNNNGAKGVQTPWQFSINGTNHDHTDWQNVPPVGDNYVFIYSKRPNQFANAWSQ